jgi:hypothetical protein
LPDRRRFGFVALSALCLVASRSFAQTVAPARPLGPGDPLPTFHIDSPGTTTIETGGPDGPRQVIEGGAVFTMGDLRISADRLVVVQQYRHLEATGHVVLTRGDESLHGSSFVLDADTATFAADDATLVSPPLFVRAAQITRGLGTMIAENAHIGVGTTDGRGEFQLYSSHVELTANQTLHLRNAAVFLYGVRLFTIRHLTLALGSGRDRGRRGPGDTSLPPIIVRDSRISGAVLGAALPFAVGRNLLGRVEADLTPKQGIEYAAILRQQIFQRGGPGSRQPGRRAEVVADETPIRQLLTARPPAPPLDPILDFTDIVPTVDTLAAPTRSAGQDLHADLTVSHHQEIGYQRLGALLLSRQPELIIAGQQPITRVIIPADNAAARRALRRPRLTIIGQANAGHYDEERLFDQRAGVRENRVGVSGGLATLPMLLGDHLLAQAQTTLRAFHYTSGSGYGYLETTVNADYVFALRTALGLTYISRDQRGTTPFLFDKVDTQDEGQIRGEAALGAHRRYTLAAVGRYDIGQKRFFDFEFALAARGHNVEPRLTYRRLNQQFGISVTLPGVTSP